MVVSFVGSHSQKTKRRSEVHCSSEEGKKKLLFLEPSPLPPPAAVLEIQNRCLLLRSSLLPLPIYLAEQYWLGAEEEEERVLEASATGLTSAGGRKEEEGIKCQAKAREGRKRRMKVQNSSLPLPPLRLGWTFWPYIMTLVALAVLYGQAKVRLDSWLFCWWGKS